MDWINVGIKRPAYARSFARLSAFARKPVIERSRIVPPGTQIMELLMHAVMTNRAALIHLCDLASPRASSASPSSSKPRCTEDRAVVSLKNSASDSEGDTRCTARVRPLDTPDRPPVVVQTAAQQPDTGRHEVWQAAAPHCGHTHAAVAQLHAGIQAAEAADQAAANAAGLAGCASQRDYLAPHLNAHRQCRTTPALPSTAGDRHRARGQMELSSRLTAPSLWLTHTLRSQTSRPTRPAPASPRRSTSRSRR